MEPFSRLLSELRARQVRFVLIGVGGANFWALDGAAIFRTKDRDLFLPPEPENLVRAWEACEACGLELTCSGEPLDRPRDDWLAERVVGLRALIWRPPRQGLLPSSLTIEGCRGPSPSPSASVAGLGSGREWREGRSVGLDGASI